MYRIMIVVKEGKNELDSLYKFLTVTNTEGKVVPFEVDNRQALDAQVEAMLNGEYRKKDFIIVQVTNYSIDTDLVGTL